MCNTHLETSSSVTKLDRWHERSLNDQYRKNFIVPSITASIECADVKHVVFLGSKTGAIPEMLSSGVSAKIITLVDIDDDAIERSKCNDYGDNKVVFQVADITRDWTLSRDADLIVVANTFLELEVTNELIMGIRRNLSEAGRVMVFLPDYLKDLLDSCEQQGFDRLKEYVDSGSTSLHKVDAFTGASYPYKICRKLHLIERFTAAGLKLTGVSRNIGGAGELCMEFAR